MTLRPDRAIQCSKVVSLQKDPLQLWIAVFHGSSYARRLYAVAPPVCSGAVCMTLRPIGLSNALKWCPLKGPLAALDSSVSRIHQRTGGSRSRPRLGALPAARRTPTMGVLRTVPSPSPPLQGHICLARPTDSRTHLASALVATCRGAVVVKHALHFKWNCSIIKVASRTYQVRLPPNVLFTGGRRQRRARARWHSRSLPMDFGEQADK